MTFLDYLILGEIVRRYFSDGSLPLQRLEALATRINNLTAEAQGEERFQDVNESLSDYKDEIQNLATLTDALLGRPAAVVDDKKDDNDKRDALQLVNQTFYESEPFQWAKWVLLIALALVGAGSLGIAGFNLLISEKMKSVSEELGKIDSGRKELQEKQKAAVTEIQNAVTAQKEATQLAFQNALNDAKRDLNGKIGEFDEFQKGRRTVIEGFVTAAGQEITSSKIAGVQKLEEKTAAETQSLADTAARKRTEIEQSQQSLNTKVEELMGFMDAQRSSIPSRIDALVGTAEQTTRAASAEGQRVIGEKTREEVAAITRFTEGKKTDLQKAYGDVGASIEGFNRFLGDERSRASGRVEAVIQESSTTVQTARDKAINEIQTQAATQVGRLKQAAERGLSDVDGAAQESIRSINRTLTEKLPPLNEKSIEAGNRIAAIVTTVLEQEQRFVNGMTDRLAQWDRTVSAEKRKLDEIAASLPPIRAQQDKLQADLATTIKISEPALEYTQRVSTGTWSNNLPLIGAVLERSAMSLTLGVVLAVLTFAIWLIIILRRI